MTTAAVDGFALRLVDGYRLHLSPRKRFHCAAGVAGHQTCSTAIRDSIRTDGLFASIPVAARQFATCARSAQQLRKEHVLQMSQGGFGGPGGGPMGGGFGGPMGGGFGGPMGGPRRRGGVEGVCCCGPLPIPFRF